MIAQPVRQALDFGERPDPAQGIFETVLVADGAAPLLMAQLERLSASAQELYATQILPQLSEDPSGVPGEPQLDGLAGRVPGGVGRLRVSFVPGRGVAVDHGPRGEDPRYTAIAPFALAGGLGPHKWLDRRLLEAITAAAGTAAAGTAAVPLLIDEDGSVLETTRSNVLVEEHGRLVSPPADGRFRSGFGRTRLRYDEEPVDLDRLLAADAVVLTSALRTLRLPLRPAG